MTNQQVDAITLGTKDLSQARKFYSEGLGCEVLAEHSEFVSLRVGDGASPLALYQWGALAGDAGVPAEGSGFRAFMLSAIVDSQDRVDEIMAQAVQAGGKLLKPARRALWGGYTGHFADMDGHVWKVAAPSPPSIIPQRRRPHTGVEPGRYAPIDPKETAITLGVQDMKLTRQFYSEGLGFAVDKSYGSKFVSFKPGNGSSALSLYTRQALADDAGVLAEGDGFRGFALSCLVESADRVRDILTTAERAGGKIVRPAQAAEWGGHFGYFTDPDGNLWKTASNA
jgi:uncharacterized protein